jgi:hypothetical protein
MLSLRVMNTSGEYVSNKEAIKSILSSFGYPIKENNDYIQTSAIFRMGDDPTSVAIYYDKNKVIDFVTSSHYTVNDFLSIVTEKKTRKNWPNIWSKTILSQI